MVVVNNHIITRKAFQQAVEQDSAALYRQFSGKELDEKLKDSREKTLQGLVDAFIMEDKALEVGIQIPDDYLKGIVEDMKKQNNFATDADFEKALRGSLGIGLPEWLKQYKRNIVQQEVLRKEVYSKIAIEEQELKAYYEDHKQEYKRSSRFRIRELVLAKGENPADAKTLATKIQEELKGGKSFEELVKTYSSSPSKSTGGDLGWMGLGLMRASIEKTALALKPGEVSDIIETDKDLYLVQLIESEDDSAKPFKDVREEILKKLQEPKAQNAIEQFLQGLRVRANIRYLVSKESILKG